MTPIKLLPILASLMFLIQCGAPPDIPYSPVERYIDEEAGVVCWYTGRGIACLPIEQTKLG